MRNVCSVINLPTTTSQCTTLVFTYLHLDNSLQRTARAAGTIYFLPDPILAIILAHPRLDSSSRLQDSCMRKLEAEEETRTSNKICCLPKRSFLFLFFSEPGSRNMVVANYVCTAMFTPSLLAIWR